MTCLFVSNLPAVSSWYQVAQQSFSEWLISNRERLGWDTPMLSAKSGVSQPLISMYENGERNPKPPKVRQLAEAMGADLDAGLLAAGRAPSNAAAITERRGDKLILAGEEYQIINPDGEPEDLVIEQEDLDYMLFRRHQEKAREKQQ